MKHLSYTCDLCKEKTALENLYCYYWDSTIHNPNGNKFGNYRLTIDFNGSDKHICKSCIKIIKESK